MAIRLFLNGCNGRMGHTIRAMASVADDLVLVAGSDLGLDPLAEFPVYQDPRQCQEPFDVVVDFSSPAALPSLCDLIEERHCAAVICTTGLDESIKGRLRTMAQTCPIFISANMSLGINLLIQLARQAARLLYPDFDLELIEAHHNQKIDAPSGTALMIADQLNEELGHSLTYVYDRSQIRQKRDQHELGIHAIRGGSIVGDHTVLFAGPEETLEIKHQAQSRAVFARGAMAAARFLAGKPAGLYSMEDLIKGQASK
jgi:4-hydroxy-tetrahydrodipicolinate reductase